MQATCKVSEVQSKVFLSKSTDRQNDKQTKPQSKKTIRRQPQPGAGDYKKTIRRQP